jgi:hypothetical protein
MKRLNLSSTILATFVSCACFVAIGCDPGNSCTDGSDALCTTSQASSLSQSEQPLRSTKPIAAKTVSVNLDQLAECSRCQAKGGMLCEAECEGMVAPDAGSYTRTLCWFLAGGNWQWEGDCVDFFTWGAPAIPDLKIRAAVQDQLSGVVDFNLSQATECARCLKSGDGPKLCQSCPPTLNTEEAGSFDRFLCWALSGGSYERERDCVDFHSGQ